MTMLLLAIILTCGLAPKTEAASWSHATKDDWPTLFPEYCAGRSQSPIDLNTKVAVTPSTDPGPITFSGYDTKASAGISNGGHGVVFAFDSFNPTISGGRLPSGDTYEFLSLHWHWGSVSSRGSEHTVDGKEFPLELHIIHWNKKYGDVGEALNYSDGLAVLGFLYQVSSADNGNLAPIVEALPSVALTRKKRRNNISQKGRKGCDSHLKHFCEGYSPSGEFCLAHCADRSSGEAHLTQTFSLNQFLPSTGAGDAYFYYSGGLTTPDCNEIVLWTNFVTLNTISESQLEAFRLLKDGSGTGTFVVDNYRDPQPLNGRTINLRKGSAAAAATGALGISGLTLGAAIGAVVMYAFLGSGIISTLLEPAQNQRSYEEFNNPVPHSFNQNYKNFY